MIDVLIIDDESAVTDLFEDYVKRFGEEKGYSFSVKKCNNGLDVLNMKYFADIVLLDMQMPGVDGIYVAKHIRSFDCNCIIMFITNLAQYAIEGYEVSALDYILKPVTYETFKLRMQRAVSKVNAVRKDEIILNVNYKTIKVNASDIIYVETAKHKLLYHTLNGIYEVWKPMSEAVKLLKDCGFSLCNSYYLINLKYVEGVQQDDVIVKGEQLKISRNKKKDFINALTEYVNR